jgi:peptidoglycan/xylan/chitin deacetylase (PgdA/CDA1 family)
MILMYHKVDIITPTIWWVTPGDLDRHVTNLKHRTFVYLEDYKSPKREVVITFDDAYENVYRHALPVLASHKVPFEVFVIGERIGGWNHFDPGEPQTRHMEMCHLEEITRHGGRVQWHTRTHPNLPDLSDDAIEEEMTVPPDLRQKLPVPHFTWFSYPGGSHDDRAIEVARRKFSGAVSVTHGKPNDRWQLNRITVDRETAISSHDMAELLRGPGIDVRL